MAKKTSTLPLLAGGAAIVLLSQSKKKSKKSNGSRWGVKVSADCKSVTITDSKLFHQFMYGAFHELVEIDPTLSLIQMSDALFGDVAPNCTGFPGEPESAEVAELYAIIARNIGQYMVDDPRLPTKMGDLIDEATQISFIDWYRAWRNYPSSDVPEPPSDQVSFSSDLTQFYIGPDWYKNTVLPFVTHAAEQGKLDTVFEDFVAQLGVLVGKFVMPISELPQSEKSVLDFLNKIEEAIFEAKKSVS